MVHISVSAGIVLRGCLPMHRPPRRVGGATLAPDALRTLNPLPAPCLFGLEAASRGGDDELGQRLLLRAVRKFSAVVYWRGTVKGFQALMMQALERGTPLTADELMKVQGHSEPLLKATK